MTVVYERRSYNEGKTLFDLKTLHDHRKLNLPVPVEELIAVEGSRRQYLPREKLTTMPQLFQPRDFEGQEGERHGHIQDLTDALNRGSVDDLDPILIWWTGRVWVVVDGAHRLIAIDRFNMAMEKKGQVKTRGIKLVPVSILSGSLSEALEWTTRENGKSHLPLTARQRSNWAWRTGVMHWSGMIEGDFVLTRKEKVMHVSRRTLTTMKATWGKLSEGKQMTPAEIMKIAGMPWSQAEKLARGADEEEVFSEEARKQKVAAMAEKLVRTLGKSAFSTTKASMVAEALLMASSRFPELSLHSAPWSQAVAEALARSGEDYDPEVDFEGDEYEDPEEDFGVA